MIGTYVDPPETLAQARRHDRNTARYLKLGLCRRCAPQAAWGHQLGFGRCNPPCEDCRPLVDTFPMEQINGWRSVPQKRKN